jgi:electron transfer flavoprotein beta subunit
MGVTGAQTARVLGWPMLSIVSKIETTAEHIKVERTMEEGRQILESKLPAVVSVSKDIGEPRYPSFMGIRKASRAKIPVWSLSELGITATQSVVSWTDVKNTPIREISTEIITGDRPEDIAEKLADKIIEEKVL